MERAISKLPVDLDDREVETQVESALLRTLDSMRHNAPANRAAARPKKSDKLPAGAAYTCAPQDDNNDSSSTSSESDDEEIAGIVDRLPEQSDEEELEEVEDDPDDQQPQQLRVDFPLESFVIAVYQDQWYVAQVLDKETEETAEKGDDYLILSFMEQVPGRNSFKWPEKKDILNTLKDDVIYKLKQPPAISTTTSSSRVTFMLTGKDFDQAKQTFIFYQAYYPTKIYLYLTFFSLSVCECV